MARPRSWDDEDLRRAVAVATSWADVCRALDLHPSTQNIRRTRARAGELQLALCERKAASNDTVPRVVHGQPEERRDRNSRTRSWSDQQFVDAVEQARSWAEVHRLLGITIGGSTYPMLQRRATVLGLDVSHFLGQAWSKGRTDLPPIARRPLHEVLVEDSTYAGTDALRRRLFSVGLKARRCEVCGLREWRGRPAPLELDHVNGIRSDNRLDNLRILCPNCHAQTDTYCGRNKAGVR